MIDREKVIKEYEDYVNSYISLTTSHDYEFEMHKAVLTLLKEQEDDYKIILSDYEELAREHEKLLEKKIPLITNGQEIIRCKDCKKQGSYDCHITSLTGQTSSDDWFCADGQPR